jgi:uncharacterized protein
MQGEEFEWDDAKARSNFAKHKVGFEAGQLVFRDLFAFDRLEPASIGETRYVITGMASGIILTVVYTERDGRTRVISARKATKHEQREYYQSQTEE